MHRLRIAILILITLGLVQLACNLPTNMPNDEGPVLPSTGGAGTPAPPVGDPAQPTPTAADAPAPTPAGQDLPPVSYTVGVISGIVWRDVCLLGGTSQPPSGSPPAGCAPDPEGGFRANGYRDLTEPGIANVSVSLGGGACPSRGLATAVTDTSGTYTFAGLVAGTYCVSIDPLSQPNGDILLPGGWSYPGPEGGNQTIVLKSGEQKTDVNFGWDDKLKMALTGGAVQAGDACTYEAAFLADVTIPDDTIVEAGASFVKTWQVRNEGTCTWGADEFGLAFAGGDPLGGPEQSPVFFEVLPGEMVDVSVSLVAPTAPGTYTGLWMLHFGGEGSGRELLLGVGPDGTGPLDVRIVVPSATVLGEPPDPSTSPVTSGFPIIRVGFEPGTTSAAVEGVLEPGEEEGYSLRAGQGYPLLARLTSEAADMRLEIRGADGRALPVTTRSDGAYLAYPLPSNQNYIVKVTGGSRKSAYILVLEIPGVLNLQEGDGTVSLGGSIHGHRPVSFLVHGRAGQSLTAVVSSPENAISLAVSDLQGGQFLPSASPEGPTTWTGRLPETQDYLLQVVPSVEATSFLLVVSAK